MTRSHVLCRRKRGWHPASSTRSPAPSGHAASSFKSPRSSGLSEYVVILTSSTSIASSHRSKDILELGMPLRINGPIRAPGYAMLKYVGGSKCMSGALDASCIGYFRKTEYQNSPSIYSITGIIYVTNTLLAI